MTLWEQIQLVETDFPWFFAAFAFVFGTIAGSFFNVCIFRIPEGRSVIFPGSRCACGKPVTWYDNVPVLSWCFLRGRARCCGQPFSIRYPAVEVLTGILFLWAWLRFEPLLAVIAMVFLGMMICASFIDLDHYLLPDRFTIGAALLGLILSALVPSLHGYTHELFLIASLQSVGSSLVGLLVGSAIILWIGILAELILKKEAMGFGDVKLLGGIGAFLGWEGAVFAIFGGALLGNIFYGALLLSHGLTGWPKGAGLKDRSPEAESAGLPEGKVLPFGPMLAGGAVLYLLWLQEFVDAYFSMVTNLARGSF